ncbi:DnaA regulatory inactivator Hda [Paraglaciecola sp. 20A4]|uniref:DnaA regulatory inactivator Hda n=1 Tax=Paraglaciecola sp. 20A4 TaxID=2687288 RepID=UPI0014084A02|nr:DnaA regulatory inactivator Hda [Paraglaciecola sp. 20A4]
MSKQLSLAVHLRDTETFDSFIVGENSHLVHRLKSLLKKTLDMQNQPWLTFVSGEYGVGKSHLLYSLCHKAQTAKVSAVYFSFKDKEQYSPEVLDGLEHSQLICLDDVDALKDSQTWQIAVFDLLNRVKELGASHVVVCANGGPTSLDLQLADLASRFAWGVSYTLASLSDEGRCVALLTRAKQRGLVMPEKVAIYLVNHWRRDMPSLMNTLDKLDQMSLQQQRKLTIPFVKEALNL